MGGKLSKAHLIQLIDVMGAGSLRTALPKCCQRPEGTWFRVCGVRGRRLHTAPYYVGSLGMSRIRVTQFAFSVKTQQGRLREMVRGAVETKPQTTRRLVNPPAGRAPVRGRQGLRI